MLKKTSLPLLVLVLIIVFGVTASASAANDDKSTESTLYDNLQELGEVKTDDEFGLTTVKIFQDVTGQLYSSVSNFHAWNSGSAYSEHFESSPTELGQIRSSDDSLVITAYRLNGQIILRSAIRDE